MTSDGDAYPVHAVGDSYHAYRNEGRGAHSTQSRVSRHAGHFSSLAAGVSNGMPWAAYHAIEVQLPSHCACIDMVGP